MQKTIYYIGNKAAAIRHLEQYFKAQNFGFVEYDYAQHKVPDILLIIEPIFIEKRNRYYGISKVWKRYLHIKSPDTKLLVVNYCESKHSNCLNLLRLPNSFNEYLDKVKIVREFEIYQNEKKAARKKRLNETPYFDDWNGENNELPIRRIDILKPLLKFFDGHANRGLKIQLNALRQTMQGAYYDLEEKDVPYEQIKEKWIEPFVIEGREWSELYDRWLRYSPLFKWTPYYQLLMRSVDGRMEELNGYFSEIEADEKMFENFDFRASLKAMNSIFEDDIEPYLRLDLLYEKLENKQ